MSTITITESIEIARPATYVWEVVADYGHDPEWRKGVSTMAPQPPGSVAVGTTTAEEMRMAGQSYRNDGIVTAVEPGRRFSWRTTEGADAHGARTVEALGPDRCRLTLELVVTPHGAEALMAPVLGPMLRRTVVGDLRRLRDQVEAATAAVA